MTHNNFDETNARRKLIRTEANPEVNLDFVASFTTSIELPSPALSLKLTIHYVPNRLIMIPESLTQYLTYIKKQAWKNLELTASTVLNDFNNEVICRWVRVCLEGQTSDGENIHHILIEDSQPGWQNETLVSRLK